MVSVWKRDDGVVSKAAPQAKKCVITSAECCKLGGDNKNLVGKESGLYHRYSHACTRAKIHVDTTNTCFANPNSSCGLSQT